MPKYAQEQIKKTIARVKEASIYDRPNQLAIEDCKTLLAALETSAKGQNSLIVAGNGMAAFITSGIGDAEVVVDRWNKAVEEVKKEKV